VNIKSVELFKKRLFLDCDEPSSNANLKEKINSEYNSWMGYFIDKYHAREH
jgi:hypothetical protein